MGCITSKEEQNQNRSLISRESFTQMELTLRLLASRAGDLRRRRRRRGGSGGGGDAENRSWLLAELAPQPAFSFGSPAEEVGTGSSATASAVLMLVFPEGEGEGGEVDTWRKRIEFLERSISPVSARLVRFAYSEILSATRNFHKGRELGRGALSRVYRGRIGIQRKSVAIKKIEAKDKESVKAFCRELMIASSLCSPNIVPIIGFCISGEGLFLVYRFVSGGSLDHHLHEKRERGKGMSWEVRYKVAIGVAQAVNYLHFGTDKCVIHRDIKPSNILLSSNKNPKLCDFGMATWTHKPSLPFLCKSVKGTFGYLAPEYFQHGKLSDKTDIYAFGVVLLELITGRKAIDRTKPRGDENLVLWAKPLLQQGEQGMEKLIDPYLTLDPIKHTELNCVTHAAAACLATDEAARPDIHQVISMLQNSNTCRDWSVNKRSGCLSGYGGSHCQPDKSDMRSHLALAMLGVSDTEEDDMYGR